MNSAAQPMAVSLPERFIHRVGVEQPAAAETAVEARARLGARFPRGAARRMTHLGMLLGAALDGMPIAADDAIVYATTFAESRALEDFLRSFPTPSPLLFQTSIHPGGVQQVLIGRQQPVARLWPLAAGAPYLVEQALALALMEPAARVLVLGGEEKGTWLLDAGMASDRAFALAIELTREPAGAVGSIRMEPASAPASATPPTLAELAEAVAERRDLRWPGQNGTWTLAWR